MSERSSKHLIFLLCLFVAALLHVLYRSSIPLQELGGHSTTDLLLRTTLALVALFYLSRRCQYSSLQFTAALIGLAILLHFPGNLTFHWDEWEILWRYADAGIASSLTAHGAHVMPVFMVYFLTQIELLQFSYPALLLVSAVLVGINGLVVEQFLLSLGAAKWFDRRAIRLLACLFVVSSLQFEVSQWAFIQCVTMQNIATVFAATMACRWQQSGTGKDLLLCLVAVAFAPLLQGTGVITVGFCFLSLWVAAALQAIADPTLKHGLRQILATSCKFAVYSGLASMPALVLYLVYGTSPEAPDLSWDMFQHADTMLAFFLNGTLGVTIMRGLGLFPSLTMDASLTTQYWSALPRIVQESIGRPENTVVALGAAVVVGVAILHLSDRQRWKLNLAFFLSGCAVIALFFLLPTLGRWQYGVQASIYSRYQTRHLLGLALLLLPLISRYVFESRSRLLSLAMWAVIAVHVLIQTYMEAQATHFIEYGQRTEQLICRAQKQPTEPIREEIEKTILPHWAFTGDVFRHVLQTHGLRCTIDGSKEVYAADPRES